MSLGNSRELQTQISFDNLTAFLYATGLIHDNEIVAEMTLGDPTTGLVQDKKTKWKHGDVVPMKIKLQEVKYTHENGEGSKT